MSAAKQQEAEQRNVVLQQPGGEMSVGQAPGPAPIPADALLGVPCRQCEALYPLPRGATTWRCRGCGHFNSLTDDGGFVICSIS